MSILLLITLSAMLSVWSCCSAVEEITTVRTNMAGQRLNPCYFYQFIGRDHLEMHFQISVYFVCPSNQHVETHPVALLSQIQRVCYLRVFYHRTPLHYAAASRHFQCLETLVSCGTCINATDQWGRSALHYAAASDLDRRYRSSLCHVFFPCWCPRPKGR